MLRLAVATLAFALLAACSSAPTSTGVQRNFPKAALRGAVVVGEAPAILLNGKAARLAPGARIRDANNMMVVPGALFGGRFLVHYTVDTSGLVKDVWILRPDEAANRWPTTAEESEKWLFVPSSQVWLKP
ncbi:MAG: hypothetical protein ABIO71_03170 [Caldimonas sp.]